MADATNAQNIQPTSSAQNEKNVYQFKILLKGIKPTIWRRIQVPEDYNFLDLSNAILSAMGWYGYHLHEFKIKNPETGAEESFSNNPEGENPFLEEEYKIKDFFINNKSKALYTYHFGNFWDHEVKLMRIVPAIPGKKYPVCIAGKRACPPEDCGGTYGYKKLLENKAKPKEELTEEDIDDLERHQMDDHDPEEFEPLDVSFESFDSF